MPDRTPTNPRRRDDRALIELIKEVRAETGADATAEPATSWRTRDRQRGSAWTRPPTGNNLVRRLTDPFRLYFDAARMFVLAGPAPFALALRGADLGDEDLGGTPLDRVGPQETPTEWRLPAEDGAPEIVLNVYRDGSGDVMLHCEVPDFPAERVHVRLEETLSGDIPFWGPLSRLAGEDLTLGPGAWRLELTFKHIAPPLVREIPIQIGVRSDD